MNQTIQFGFILEYVNNIEAAKNFYTNVLGLKVQRYHPTFVQFEHFAIASDQSMSGTRKPEVYWLIDDAEALYKEFAQQVEISMPMKELPFGKVFAIKDPAGEPLYLLEFAAERPSQPVD